MRLILSNFKTLYKPNRFITRFCFNYDSLADIYLGILEHNDYFTLSAWVLWNINYYLSDIDLLIIEHYDYLTDIYLSIIEHTDCSANICIGIIELYDYLTYICLGSIENYDYCTNICLGNIEH